ncbi:MAG: glycosyltransferase [Flavobacteriaceae bacterium]|nr:glycosyltransferase [Flavobacteriaceae bacterium]
MKLQFSIIIPIYNRTEELDELLSTIEVQSYEGSFDITIVDDGSSVSYSDIIDKYSEKLDIKYFYKENTGPGLSRNYGMNLAKGNYFIILDSDCLLPIDYLKEVEKALKDNYTDAFGGPDEAHDSFNYTQKAINYAMTSYLSTGGIRGKKNTAGKFQLRSFNMGLSKHAYEVTKGFSADRIGEDIDLTFRLWNNNIETQLIEKAFVYHKRRVDITMFYKQVNQFGKQRPILNKKYKGTAKLTYWFPSLFIIGLVFSLVVLLLGNSFFIKCYLLYIMAVFINSTYKTKNTIIAVMSIYTVFIQFTAYGTGFLQSFIKNIKK